MKLSTAIEEGIRIRVARAGALAARDAYGAPFVYVANAGILISDIWGAVAEAVEPRAADLPGWMPVRQADGSSAPDRFKFMAACGRIHDLIRHHFPVYFQTLFVCPHARRSFVYAGGRITGALLTDNPRYKIERERPHRIPMTSACGYTTFAAQLQHFYYDHRLTRLEVAELARAGEQLLAGRSGEQAFPFFEHREAVQIKQVTSPVR
jgi:hypothetical protein